MPRADHGATYRIRPGEPLTVDVRGLDGTQLRIRGVLDSAPDGAGYGGPATRIVIRDAVARVIED